MPEDGETGTKISQDWNKPKVLSLPINIPGDFQLCTTVFSKEKCRLYPLETQSLLDLCAREENEHSPKIPHVLRGLTEMVRQDQEQTPMFLSSFALQVKLDEQTVSLENMFSLSPCLYIMGLANQPVTNQLS